jgi:ribosomal protein S18 acetylase RimI-like enzyme
MSAGGPETSAHHEPESDRSASRSTGSGDARAGLTIHSSEGSGALDVEAAAGLLGDLVEAGAALGWVERPTRTEVAELVTDVTSAAATGDASLVWVTDEDSRLVGLGYWRRYGRPTHRPHADLERVAVAVDHHGRGIGRVLMLELIRSARAASIEQLTLDARGDNAAAFALYESLGFVEYGRLHDFVAFGQRRYDKVFMVLDLR